jgi:hypothetical protein
MITLWIEAIVLFGPGRRKCFTGGHEIGTPAGKPQSSMKELQLGV